MATWYLCNVSAQFGPHGGRQFRCHRYMICGCDAGMCEVHAKLRMEASPIGPKYKLGRPKKCRQHNDKFPAHLAEK